MAGSTFYGTTLSDLQGARTAQDRMDAERQQLAQRLFSQAVQGQAERAAAKDRLDQERAYQYFGLAQQDQQAAADRALKAQQFNLQGQAEIERQKAEQARTAALLEAERIRNQGLMIQYPEGRLDPKMLEQIQKQNDAAMQTNTIAEAAAREANFLLGQTLKSAQEEADKVGPSTWTPWGPDAQEVGRLRAEKYRALVSQGVDAIRTKLADRAQYLTFGGKSFEPLKLPIHELPTRQSFPGTAAPGAAGYDADLAGRVGADVTPVNRVFPGTTPALQPPVTPQFQVTPGGGFRVWRSGASTTNASPQFFNPPQPRILDPDPENNY